MNQPANASENSRPPLSGGKALLLLFVLLVVAAVLAVTGVIPRLRARSELQTQTTQLATPTVIVDAPIQGSPVQELVLPGNMQAYTDSSIYARTNGYLKKWNFDIGAHVRKGQLLAVIESPEIDQQLAQAKADLATAEANAKNAKIQSARYQDLLKANAVSAQDTDTYTTQEKSTGTQVESAAANVQHYEQLVGFENVYAPFDGTVTLRNVDIGSLINEGAGTTAGSELFHLSDEHVLRVYVNVPQVYSVAVQPGVTATLTLGEFPGRTFTGNVVRTARAIDLTTRTLLVEVDVNNPKGELYPGAYAQVHFKIPTTRPSLVVPVSALMFRSEGLRVGIVQNNKARLVPVTIGQDDGKTAAIIEGLNADDAVVQNPPDSLIDGETVQVKQLKKSAPEPPDSGNAQGGGK
ncbi:efflux RND transporter periplasmic adaptor subunit [Silvibacterium dinghuense]|uniref:Efflux RND transporter periplasmic adaptor subunit n=1 Tax=Silvibacterium dinghuense TaxID=1560006 RepID=A0A4Q1SJC2_9BACT|nr:efflux RND transporter periplasmic adaptor subunit [Silvibacterium dinghuense]RXS97529.1 efflux RND transporter periplasmic adaptor subunit [Silvibacterium dinghuense]GGG99758.1 RND transporter MFP subunit [Silvibacterium dinghuense]